MVQVEATVDSEIESYMEASVTISNFMERYHAAQNEALDKDDRIFVSKPIPCPCLDTNSMRQVMGEIQVTVVLNNVS